MDLTGEGTIRVLHIDDDEDFSDILQSTLERQDPSLEIETATDPETGLAKFCEDVDCIVCDYKMPGKDGLEILEAVREQCPNIPFILFTGEGSEKIAAEAIEREVTSYLQKEGGTAQFTVLANRIRNHVAQYRASKRADRLEQKYHLLAEIATDVFWTVDLQTQAITFGEGIERFGYDLSDVEPGFDWWVDRIHQGDRDRILEMHEAHTTPDESGFEEYDGIRGRFEIEYRWQRGDGSFAHIHARGVTIFEDGEAVRQIGTLTDVTDRMERERDLELLETLVDHSTDAVFVTDLDTGALAYVNKTVCKQLGYSRSELIGKPVPEISTNYADLDSFEDHLEELRETGNIREEDRHIRADGSKLPMEIAASHVEIDGLEYVVAIGRDISERIERQRNLNLLEKFVEESNDSFFVIDTETRIVQQVNQKAADLLGYEPDDLVGSPIEDVSSDFDGPEDWQEHVETLKEVGTERYEDTQIHADGTERPVEARISYVELDGKGYVVRVGRDISWFKQQEAKLKDKNERLERFVSVVSHDLRNPLNVADGYLDMARENGSDEYFDRVEGALDRMNRIIDDLLYLTNEGMDIGTRERVQLRSLVEKSWKTVQMHSTESSLIVSDDLPTVEADNDRFRQLIENILVNAIEHGGDDVRITVESIDDGFAIEDDGPGIPPKEREKVFDEGFTTIQEGTGLGLSIVRKVVNAHGWDICVTDSLDGGARFEITGIESSETGAE